jgi:drug/metabolite transporter (DMT)-like permease
MAGALVVGVCAVSAGVHAALVPEHLQEAPPLGVSFAVASVLLLLAGAVVVMRPDDQRAARVTALLLAGLIASWAVSGISGIPLLQPQPESVDGVGLITKLVEALGLGFAMVLIQPVGGRRRPALQEVDR